MWGKGVPVLIPLTGRDRLNYTKSGRGFLRRYRTVFRFRYSFYTNPDSAENLNTNPDSIFFTQREKKNLQLLNCFFWVYGKEQWNTVPVPYIDDKSLKVFNILKCFASTGTWIRIRIRITDQDPEGH